MKFTGVDSFGSAAAPALHRPRTRRWSRRAPTLSATLRALTARLRRDRLHRGGAFEPDRLGLRRREARQREEGRRRHGRSRGGGCGGGRGRGLVPGGFDKRQPLRGGAGDSDRGRDRARLDGGRLDRPSTGRSRPTWRRSLPPPPIAGPPRPRARCRLVPAPWRGPQAR